MVWAAMSRFRKPVPAHGILGTMDQHLYAEIQENVMNPTALKNMRRGFIFQRDNGPKHISRKVKQWFEAKRIKVLKWPAQ